jgi:hypothetical protein
MNKWMKAKNKIKHSTVQHRKRQDYKASRSVLKVFDDRTQSFKQQQYKVCIDRKSEQKRNYYEIANI